MEENLGVLQENMGCRSAATQHAASRRPAVVMLVGDIMVMAGRSRPLMGNDYGWSNLSTVRDTRDLGVGLDLCLGLRRGSRSVGSDGASACRCDAHRAGERHHHHSHK